MKLTPIASNMTELELDGMKILFSYKTPVAAQHIASMVYTKTSKFWSKTTSRHINQWVNGNTAYENPQEYFDNLVQSVESVGGQITMPSTIAKTATGIGSQAKIYNGHGVFEVTLHRTIVYSEMDNKIILNNGTWITPTTVRYMNQALTYRGFTDQAVTIKKGVMLLNGKPFEGTIAVINLKGGLI